MPPWRGRRGAARSPLPRLDQQHRHPPEPVPALPPWERHLEAQSPSRHPTLPMCPATAPEPTAGHDRHRTGQGRRQRWRCQEGDSRLGAALGVSEGSVPSTGVPSAGVGARGIPAVPGGAAGRRPPAQTLNGGAGAQPAPPLRAGGALPGRENPPPCQPKAGRGTPAAQRPPRTGGGTEAGPRVG